MVVQFSDDMLDGFAPNLSKLRPFDLQCPRELPFDIASLAYSFAWRQVLSGEHTTLSILRQFARRVFYARTGYVRAISALTIFFRDYQHDSPKISLYFEALNELESCLLNIQMAVESVNKSGYGTLISGAEVEACLNLANNLKHFGERRSKKGPRPSIPVWIEDDLLVGERYKVRIAAMGVLISELVELATQLGVPNAASRQSKS